MAGPVTITELARRLGRSDRQLRRLATAGKIPRREDGTFDEAAVRKALESRTGPHRARPLNKPSGPKPRPVVTPADAREAVSLIAEILAEEGRPLARGRPPSFDDLRSAESILKSRDRALKLAERGHRVANILQRALAAPNPKRAVRLTARAAGQLRALAKKVQKLQARGRIASDCAATIVDVVNDALAALG